MLDDDADVGIGTMIVFIALILVAAVTAGVLISIALLVKQQAEETASNAVADTATSFKVINLAGDRGKDAFATIPIDPNSDNVGNGIISEVITNNRVTKTEKWKVECIKTEKDGGIFSVTGSISGTQSDYNITKGQYTSNNNEITFRIYDGSIDFEVGDDFEFNTTSLTLKSKIQKLEIKLTTMTGSPAINLSNTIIEISDGYVDVSLSYKDGILDGKSFDVETIRDLYGELENDLVLGDGSLVKVLIDCNAVGLNLVNGKRVAIKLIAEHGIPTYETFVTPSGYRDRYIELV